MDKKADSVSKLLLWLFVSFSVLVAGLMAYFLINDFCAFTLPNPDLAKFLVVCVTPLFPAARLLTHAFAKKENPRQLQDYLLLSALLLTACSDFVLLFFEQIAWIGLIPFTFAQLAHFVRLYVEAGKNKTHLIASFIAWGLISGTAMALGLALIEQSPLIVLASLYGGRLLLNLFESTLFAFMQRQWRFILLCVGFALFVACDVFVVLRYANVTGAWRFIWVCYAPSQLLLAWSCHEPEKKRT
ncbi:MAG: hypothetical protein K6E59_02395 [Bacilli bacterium]|nr:hypothetical protein [Bacilli bacterium]